MTSNAAALLLADGRLPVGGYAHSGGLEPSIATGRVSDVASLESFLQGRAVTTGVTLATFAAAACGAFADRDHDRLDVLDVELDARIPSPAQRSTSRSLGRQFLRAVGAARPDSNYEGVGMCPHHPVAVGAAAADFELSRSDAALIVLNESVAGPVAAAVRLLSIDPFSVYGILARLGPLIDALAADAERHSHEEGDDLPAAGAPLLDIAAEAHAKRQTRLFAS